MALRSLLAILVDHALMHAACYLESFRLRVNPQDKDALFHFCFSLYINDVDCKARDVRGAVTGIADVCVTHII